MRRFALLALLVSLLGAMAVSPAVAAPEDEVLVIDLINTSRGEAGLAPLEVDYDLIVAARGHSAEMADAAELFHSTRGQLASYAEGWDLMGENVGRGPNVRAVHDAFMESETHRNNVLGGFDTVGVGVVRSDDGTLFVTVVFMLRSPGNEVAEFDTGPMILISGLPEFAVSRLLAAAEIFERSGRDLCSPLGSSGSACID
jgi:hypothetical protein